jgi:hypothetical protein
MSTTITMTATAIPALAPALRELPEELDEHE